MTLHRNQAQFDRARWCRILLFPLWLLQVATLLSLMGIFSYRLAETIENFDDSEENGKTPLVEIVWECTNVGFSLTSLLLTLLEMARLFSETLTPFFMLASHTVKIANAFAILGLDITVYTQRSEGRWSIIGLALDVGLLTSMISLGIYSIITYRRVFQDGELHHPANVKPFGFDRNGYYNLKTNRRESDSFLTIPPYSHGVTGGGGRTDGGIMGESRSRSVSAASTLHMSFLSSKGHVLEPVSIAHRQSSGVGGAEEDGSQRASYSHERDTLFDEYVTRPLSRSDIDEAMGAELWGTKNGSLRTSLERSDSVVGSGVVARKNVQPHPSGRNRSASWLEEAGIVIVPEGIQEEEEDAAVLKMKKTRLAKEGAGEDKGASGEKGDRARAAVESERSCSGGESQALLC